MRGEGARPGAVLLLNAWRAAGRSLFPEERRERIAVAIAALSAVAFALFLGWGASEMLSLSERGLAQLPDLKPQILLVHLLRALLLGAAFLLLLGCLTSSVSLLFLSDELPALLPLQIPHRVLFRRLLFRSIAAASAPTLFLALPLGVVAAARSPSPTFAAAGLAIALAAVILPAGALGATFAVLLVRIVPPHRAKLLAATLSAIGLAAALVGIRGARPERLFDPVSAFEILQRLGTSPPPPAAGPIGWAAEASRLALSGSASGAWLAAGLAAVSLLVVALAAALLAPLHLATWRRARESGSEARAGSDRGNGVRSLDRELLRAEARSFLRDASTPAQLGSLAAVFVLDLLNLWLLPATDAAARDLVGGLQTGLALFLVSALSLRFAYPAVSADGRAALLLKSFPLSPTRHLLARYLVRALPALLVTTLLLSVSGAVLRLEPAPFLVSLFTGLIGATFIPALHIGLGALFPRYGAPNAVAAALGPGGLFALAVSTLLSLLSAPLVSTELRGLFAVLAGVRLDEGILVAAWSAAAAAAGLLPLLLATGSMKRQDVSLA